MNYQYLSSSVLICIAAAEQLPVRAVKGCLKILDRKDTTSYSIRFIDKAFLTRLCLCFFLFRTFQCDILKATQTDAKRKRFSMFKKVTSFLSSLFMIHRGHFQPHLSRKNVLLLHPTRFIGQHVRHINYMYPTQRFPILELLYL